MTSPGSIPKEISTLPAGGIVEQAYTKPSSAAMRTSSTSSTEKSSVTARLAASMRTERAYSADAGTLRMTLSESIAAP